MTKLTFVIEQTPTGLSGYIKEIDVFTSGVVLSELLCNLEHAVILYCEARPLEKPIVISFEQDGHAMVMQIVIK